MYSQPFCSRSVEWGMYLKSERGISTSNTTPQATQKCRLAEFQCLVKSTSLAAGTEEIRYCKEKNFAERFAMKVTGCICCMLGLVTMIVSTTDTVGFEDKTDQQFFDSPPIEDSPKDKRPFCNAFTGCGKKRSFYSDNSLESNDESSKRIQIPVLIYRSLLRAAGEEIRDSLVNRETSGDNTISNLAIDYPAYLARNMQSRERYQS